MRTTRKVLTLIVIVLLPAAGGCLVGAVTAGLATYGITSPAQTKAYTEISNVPGGRYLTSAVETWLERGQLPLPEGLADGTHRFSIDVGDRVEVPHSRGARIVHLYAGGRLIADYTVLWDRRPPEYRLHKAESRLYAGELDVTGTPTLQLQEFYEAL
jgi:hypothetical protein